MTQNGHRFVEGRLASQFGCALAAAGKLASNIVTILAVQCFMPTNVVRG
jgi:hypothetical protein